MTILLLQYSTLTFGVQIELRFALRAMVFELFACKDFPIRDHDKTPSGSRRAPYIVAHCTRTQLRRTKNATYVEQLSLGDMHTKFEVSRCKIQIRNRCQIQPILKMLFGRQIRIVIQISIKLYMMVGLYGTLIRDFLETSAAINFRVISENIEKRPISQW